MTRFSPASPEFKAVLEEINPNEYGLDTMDWLKITAQKLDMDYARLCRLWRDNRAKIHRYEEIRISDVLLEIRTMRDIRKNKLIQKYQSYKLVGALNDMEETTAANGFCTQRSSGAIA
jgi:hypothetical protein